MYIDGTLLLGLFKLKPFHEVLPLSQSRPSPFYPSTWTRIQHLLVSQPCLLSVLKECNSTSEKPDSAADG